MNDHHIPELKIERLDDDDDSLILLEQDAGGNIDRVAIHPVHLRFMAEQFGLVAASDPQAHKTISSLMRRLRVLRERIDHLADYLALHSDHEHADLIYETTYAAATAEIAFEFVADFDEPAPPDNRGTNPVPTQLELIP